jgi:hypothetical protein
MEQLQEHPEMFLTVPFYVSIFVLTGGAVLCRKISDIAVLASKAEEYIK